MTHSLTTWNQEMLAHLKSIFFTQDKWFVTSLNVPSILSPPTSCLIPKPWALPYFFPWFSFSFTKTRTCPLWSSLYKSPQTGLSFVCFLYVFFFFESMNKTSKNIIRKHIYTVPNTLPVPITVNKAAIVNLVKEIIYWWIRSSLVHKINLPVHQCCCTSNPVLLVGPFHSPCCWSLESSNKNIAKDTADQGAHWFYQIYN